MKGVVKDVIGADLQGRSRRACWRTGREWRKSATSTTSVPTRSVRRAYGRDSFECGKDSEGRFRVNGTHQADFVRETVERARALVPAG